MDITERKITKIAREVSKFTVRQLREEGVGASEFDVIHAVRKNPGITQAGVCRITGLDKGAVARQAANLEAKGYIVRKDNEDDGRSRSKTLSSAQLESGKRYDMSVVVTNIDIDVELSGEVVDWGDGGSLDGSGEGGGGDGGGGEGGGEGGDPGTLSYGGVDYPTATIGGRVWMTRNLRYLPDGAQIGTGIWYPCRGTAGSNDAEYVAERGLLYSFTTALGGATAASGTPVQGICPPGWHVPTGAEIEQMIASPEYDASLLRSAGMLVSDTGLYITEKKGYLMSCTSEDNGANYQAMPYSSGGIVAGLAPFPAGNGVSLRCVKDI